MIMCDRLKKLVGSAQRLSCLLHKATELLILGLFLCSQVYVDVVFTPLDVLFADHGVNHLIVGGALGLCAPFMVVVCRFVITVLAVVTCAKLRTEDTRLEALTIVLLASSLATIAALEVFLSVRVTVS